MRFFRVADRARPGDSAPGLDRVGMSAADADALDIDIAPVVEASDLLDEAIVVVGRYDDDAGAAPIAVAPSVVAPAVVSPAVMAPSVIAAPIVVTPVMATTLIEAALMLAAVTAPFFIIVAGPGCGSRRQRDGRNNGGHRSQCDFLHGLHPVGWIRVRQH